MKKNVDVCIFFFFNDTATTEIYTLSLHDALPIFAAVMTGFLLHELAHKWMAQKYGCWAEYRGNRNGLLLALLMGAFGFLIAAPGAVMVAGHVTPRQHGHIAAVGPLTNIALALGSEEHTSELQSRRNLVCRPLLEKKKPQSAQQLL